VPQRQVFTRDDPGRNAPFQNGRQHHRGQNQNTGCMGTTLPLIQVPLSPKAIHTAQQAHPSLGTEQMSSQSTGSFSRVFGSTRPKSPTADTPPRRNPRR
jgi:hypothetical protein